MNRQDRRAIRAMTSRELKGLAGMDLHVVEQAIAWLTEEDTRFRFDESGFDEALERCAERLNRVLEDQLEDFMADVLDLASTRTILDIEQPYELQLMAIPMIGPLKEIEAFVLDTTRVRSLERSIAEAEILGEGVELRASGVLMDLETASAIRPGALHRAMAVLVDCWISDDENPVDEAAEIVGGYRPAARQGQQDGQQEANVMAPRLLLVAVKDASALADYDPAKLHPTEDDLFHAILRWMERMDDLVPLVEFGQPQTLDAAFDEALVMRLSHLIDVEVLMNGMETDHVFDHAHIHMDDHQRLHVSLSGAGRTIGPVATPMTMSAMDQVLDEMEERAAVLIEHDSLEALLSASHPDETVRTTN